MGDYSGRCTGYIVGVGSNGPWDGWFCSRASIGDGLMEEDEGLWRGLRTDRAREADRNGFELRSFRFNNGFSYGVSVLAIRLRFGLMNLID